MDEQDPRVREGICGVTDIRENIEFICVKDVHAKIYTRNKDSGWNRRGGVIFDTSPKADQHYFVNRWPNRPLALQNS